MIFKVIFTMDGAGIYIDPTAPLHIDALLAWNLAPILGDKEHNLGRSEKPEIINLPLKKLHINNSWVWRASALFPEGETGEDLQFWRKRFRQGQADLSTGKPDIRCSSYRDWNAPIPLLLTNKMVGYANGNRRACLKLLRRLTHLGKKRSYGYGKIIKVECEQILDDYSIVKDGIAMRNTPFSHGNSYARVQPPYWNSCDRMNCVIAGDPLGCITKA